MNPSDDSNQREVSMRYDSYLLGVKHDQNMPTLNVVEGTMHPSLNAWLDARAKDGWTLVSSQLNGTLHVNSSASHPDGELLVIMAKP
jgi:hypothetical protein